MGIATTDFPGALDSKDSLVWAANNASTTLATTINDTDTSIVLTSAAAFPASGIIRIDDELIAYSSKATNTLTVQASPTGRGFESTTAASHTSGATVRLIISAASHNVQSDAIVATQTKIGTGSSTPIANTVLTGTGTGTSAWATISNAFIASNAAIALSKLAAVTASRALVSDASGVISASSVTATELGYVSGVTSAIQTQLSGKVSTGFITTSGLTIGNLSHLLGRGTSAGTSIQEISLDATLAFSGTILSTVPAGSANQIQYNDSGFYGASPRFTFVTNGLSSDVLITTPEDTNYSRLLLQRARSGPAAVTSGNVLGELLFQGYNASYLDGASIQATTTANWASSQSAKFLFSVRNGGTAFVYDLQFDRFLPPSDNSASLGISGTAWSTLHTRSITLAGSTSGTTVLQAAATAAGTYTWPGSDGTSGQVLSTNGSGVLSWASVTASAAGADTQLQRNNGGALGAVTGATSNGTSVTFSSGNLIATSPSITTSLTTGSTSFDLINTTATTVNFAGAATTVNMAGGSGAVVNLGGGANAAELRFLEPSGSGTNYTALKAQAQAANVTYTLPAADGTNGQVLSTNGSGTLSWATVSGGGSPGGSSGQVQFNSAGSFGGAAGFTYQSGASPNVTITAQSASHIPLTISSAATPTAKLLSIQNNGTERIAITSGFIQEFYSVGTSASILSAYEGTTSSSQIRASLTRGSLGFYETNAIFENTANLNTIVRSGSNRLAIANGQTAEFYYSTGSSAIVYNALIMRVNQGGTPTAGYGCGLAFGIKTNTADRTAATLAAAWSTVTDGSRSAYFTTSLEDNAITREYVRVAGNGANTATIETATCTSGATTVTALLEQNVTLSTAGNTTDTTIQIPANSFVLAVSVRVTTTIAGVDSTSLQVGDATTAERFGSIGTLTANTTGVGLNQLQGNVSTNPAGPIVTSATAVRLTLTGGSDNIPSAGAVRVTIHYIQLTAATS